MASDFNLELCKRVNRGEVTPHPFTLFSEQVIKLSCGETVKIQNLDQFHTYGGMLAGVPLDIHIPRSLDEAVKVAKGLYSDRPTEPVLLPPEISYGWIQHRSLSYPSRATDVEGGSNIYNWEMLPQITTVALLQAKKSFDSVLVIWFQDEIGYPDANIIDQLKGLNWGAHVLENDFLE